MNGLMISCKKASELIDKKMIVKISLGDSVRLQVHTAMCGCCKAYIKQSKLLNDLLDKHMLRTDESQIPTVIIVELEQRILSKL